jgi:hypothetical protein
VATDNIMQDEVYRYFFEKILEDELGKNSEYDDVINKLLKEIEAKNGPKRKATDSINTSKKIEITV